MEDETRNPISPGGRLLDIVMEAYAIAVIETMAGSFGSFLQKRGVERDAQAVHRDPRSAP